MTWIWIVLGAIALLIVCGMMAVVSVAARDEETSDDNRHWYDGED